MLIEVCGEFVACAAVVVSLLAPMALHEAMTP